MRDFCGTFEGWRGETTATRRRPHESHPESGVMVRMSPRLQKDVNAVEENELRRMEGLPPVSVAVGVGDRAVVGAAGGGVAAAEAFEADEAASRGGVLMAAATRDDGTKSAGVIVQGAAQRRDELASKMFANGGFDFWDRCRYRSVR